jgi:hypothetical protein
MRVWRSEKTCGPRPAVSLSPSPSLLASSFYILADHRTAAKVLRVPALLRYTARPAVTFIEKPHVVLWTRGAQGHQANIRKGRGRQRPRPSPRPLGRWVRGRRSSRYGRLPQEGSLA